MRISTNMIFDAGVAGINQQTATSLQLQQQIASGRRIVTPSDDPVAAARALEVQQAKDIGSQFSTNHDNANTALGLEDGSLSAANDLLARVRELAVAAQGGALTAAGRKAIATELRSSFDQLVGIANSTDGTGQYLFSGYMGSTQPFAGSVDGMLAAPATDIAYLGDDGQRRLQVAPSRYLEISDSGNDVFKRISSGNGYFTTTYAAGNTGSGVISVGSVTDPAAWNSAANSKNLEVRFWVDAAGAVGPANTTYYDLVDATSGNSLFTNSASTTGVGGTYSHAYIANQPINFSGLAAPYNDFGAALTVTGAPATGDHFSLQASSSQSIFKTLSKLIGTVESSTSSAASQANYRTDLSAALVNLDQASTSIATVRAAVGSRMNEVTALANTNSALDLQYAQTLSTLQDLDYTKAISDLTRTQTMLDAAEKSFKAVSQLSLFNYL
jgi:flagellar hook-associated protein 3 FlgL